jgi:excinuclease ABC subunit B
VIIVASVSCIYGLGSGKEYLEQVLVDAPGIQMSREQIIERLVDIHYQRNEIDFHRGTFRVRGDVLEIIPASYSESALRVELFGDEVERLREIDLVSGKVTGDRDHVAIFPATHYVTAPDQLKRALGDIEAELHERSPTLRKKTSCLRRSAWNNAQIRPGNDAGNWFLQWH